MGDQVRYQRRKNWGSNGRGNFPTNNRVDPNRTDFLGFFIDNTMIWKEVCVLWKAFLNKPWLLFWSVSFPVACCDWMSQKIYSSIVVRQGFKWDKYFSIELIFSQKGQQKETSNDRIHYVQRQTLFSSKCWKRIYRLRNTNKLRNSNILNIWIEGY